jgi:hypothetical protein
LRRLGLAGTAHVDAQSTTIRAKLVLSEPAHRAAGGRVVYSKMARSHGVHDLTPFPRFPMWRAP